MERLKKYKQLIIFYLVVNILFGLLITMSSYVHVPMVGFKDGVSYLGHFLLMQFSLFGFIYFLTINRWLFYVLFIPLFFLLSVIAFFGFSQDIVVSAGVIQASLETKSDVVFGLVSWQLFGFITLVLLVILNLIKLYRQIDLPKFNMTLCVISILSLLSFFVIEHKRSGTLKNRLPYTLYFETVKLIAQPKIKFQAIQQNLTQKSDSLQVIFVLGESVRADHLQLNGYDRPTNPKLSHQENLISFAKGFTNHTYTGASVPQILSDASVNDDYKEAKISLIDVLNHSKISTTWIGNQTPENSYLHFIQNSTNKIFVDPTHSEFSFNKELDEVMLPPLFQQIKQRQNQFILVHMMGSHWYYENRYGDKHRKFLPVIESKYIPSNTRAEMVNSYDNTLLYLDEFLSEIIQFLEQKNQNSILVYVSDHGELLGENGKYLHAQPGQEKAARNPAVMIWYSKKFAQNNPEKINFLKLNQNKQLPLDFVFHSILALYEVDLTGFNPNFNLFGNFKP